MRKLHFAKGLNSTAQLAKQRHAYQVYDGHISFVKCLVYNLYIISLETH